MTIKNYLQLLILMAVCGTVASCNKDDVIIDNNSDDSQESGMRPPTDTSSQYIDRVIEWMPAPGQQINDFGGDFPMLDVSAEEASAWAQERLLKRNFVSLGAFGGYIVVGFDHSISNTGGFEIGVFGNAFLSANGGSNEPGIVYVMQDLNHNNIPDDTWYELRGSDTMAKGTRRNYSVTYYRPSEDGQPVEWTDNLGNSGIIDYLGAFHSQPSYYPAWVDSDSYTLSGTCLEAKTVQNPETGNWDNPPFEWGYADNMGEDNIQFDGMPNCNRFRITDAIDEEGNPVTLDYIDFVKIQTGVCATAGWLGEVSTEVLGIVDLTMDR